MPRLDDSKAAKLLAVFVAVLAVFSSAHADTINVPGDQPTIQAGIDATVIH